MEENNTLKSEEKVNVLEIDNNKQVEYTYEEVYSMIDKLYKAKLTYKDKFSTLKSSTKFLKLECQQFSKKIFHNALARSGRISI